MDVPIYGSWWRKLLVSVTKEEFELASTGEVVRARYGECNVRYGVLEVAPAWRPNTAIHAFKNAASLHQKLYGISWIITNTPIISFHNYSDCRKSSLCSEVQQILLCRHILSGIQRCRYAGEKRNRHTGTWSWEQKKKSIWDDGGIVWVWIFLPTVSIENILAKFCWWRDKWCTAMSFPRIFKHRPFVEFITTFAILIIPILVSVTPWRGKNLKLKL